MCPSVLKNRLVFAWLVQKQIRKLNVCRDSHAATNGFFGAIAFGIRASEFEHVFAIQYLWQVKLKKILVEFIGLYQKGGYSKDFIFTLLPSTELLVVLAIWLKIGGELLMHPRWES